MSEKRKIRLEQLENRACDDKAEGSAAYVYFLDDGAYSSDGRRGLVVPYELGYNPPDESAIIISGENAAKVARFFRKRVSPESGITVHETDSELVFECGALIAPETIKIPIANVDVPKFKEHICFDESQNGIIVNAEYLASMLKAVAKSSDTDHVKIIQSKVGFSIVAVTSENGNTPESKAIVAKCS